MHVKIKEYYCPNCGTKNVFTIHKNRAFKSCTKCGNLLRYATWLNKKVQLIGYIK